MQFNNFVFLGVLLVAVFGVHESVAQCKTCFKNGASCISETSFNLCFEDQADTSTEYFCPEGTYCSVGQDICSSEAPSCNRVMTCGICNGNSLFACTSRTTFAQCDGNTLTDIPYQCPEGFVCDATGGAICVKEEQAPIALRCGDVI